MIAVNRPALGFPVYLFNVHKGHPLFLFCGQTRQRLLHIQFTEAAGFPLQSLAEVDGFVEVRAAGAQTFHLQMHKFHERQVYNHI